MKNFSKIAGLALTMITALSACKKDDILPSDPQSSVRSLQSTQFLTQGTWRISSFQWHNRENNPHLEGYKFRFATNGVVRAASNNSLIEGKWGSNDNFLFLNFGIMKPVNEINNKHWYITGYTDGTLSLRGLSPVDNSSEYIVFERIAVVTPR